MGMFGTSNGTVLGAVQASNDTQFKSMNNLLSLQDNHVEEFFQYHGEAFLSALEKLMEDVIERVVSQMLGIICNNLAQHKPLPMSQAIPNNITK